MFAAVVAGALFLGALQLSGPHTGADFVCLYGAGKTILLGQGAKLYDYSTQLQIQAAYTGNAIPNMNAHAPPEALLFLPLALFRYPTAYLLWAGVNLILLGSCAFLLRCWLSKLSLWDLLLLAAAVFIPILAAIWHGQDSLLVLLIYAAAFRLMHRGEEFKAGAVLGLALFKVELVAPFIVLALARRARSFFADFLAVGAGFAVVSVATAGLRMTLGYPAFLWSLHRNKEWIASHLSFPGWMPNLHGLAYALSHNLVPERFLNLGVVAVSLLLVLWAALARRRRIPPGSEPFATTFSFDLLVTLLVSWHMYVHDLSLLFLPALLLLAATTSGGLENRRYRLLVRASLMVAFIGELCGVAWFPYPKQFAGVAVGLLLLLWSCASLPRQQPCLRT
jgi:hypothetical protein